MKLKKFIAVTTAIAVALLPTSTAFADQTSLNQAALTYDASVDYIDVTTTAVRVVLPTSASLAFTLDPQNLAATQGVGNWDPSSGGQILPAAAVIMANRSAFPVKAKVAISLTDAATTKTTIVDSATNINNDTTRKMNLTFTPAKDKTTIVASTISATSGPAIFYTGGSPAVFTAADLTAANVAPEKIVANSASGSAIFGDFVCVDDSVTPSTAKTYNQVEVPTIASDIPATTETTAKEFLNTHTSTTEVDLSSTGAALDFVLGKASYYAVKNAGVYSLVYQDKTTNTNYDTASFIIGGTINKNADWSVYNTTTKISLTATYTFEAMTDSQATAATKITGTHNSVDTAAPVPNVAASVTPTNVNLSKVSGATAAIDLGSGTSVATGITSLVTVVSGTDYPWEAGWWSFNSSTKVLTLNTTAAVAALAVGQVRTVKVTFNTGATDTFTVTIAN